MDLIVEGRGCFVGKHQGRLRVSREGKTLTEAPIIHLEHVLIVDAGVSISSDAVQVCAEEGIPIHFISAAGRTHASLYSAGLTGTVLTRRAQLAAYSTPLGLALAVAYVRAKLENQVNLLRYVGKYRKETAPEVFAEITLVAAELRDHLAELAKLTASAGSGVAEVVETMAGALRADAVGAAATAEQAPLGAQTVEALREQVMSVEGRAAQRYWRVVGMVIPQALGWPGRETRGALDPFNSALNYGYGILYAQVERALTLAGLDPYGGFLHADRPGKPSLVLDAIEEFRQTVVDRTVIAFVTRGSPLEQDEQGMLTEPVRRHLAEKVLERLEGTEVYEGKRQTLRVIVQSQARHAATFLRGERAEYTPFVAAW